MTRIGKPTIVVLGGLNMDLVAVAPRLPAPGETVAGQRFYTAPGGKGANQGVAAARLGARVRMVGRVGRDEFGATLLSNLRRDGIDVSGVEEDPANISGVAVILLDARRENHIVAVYGANMACDSNQLDAAKSALDGADVLMLQSEIPLEVSLAAARYAMERGVTVLWDPAPAAEMPPETFDSVSILTPNQTEAEALSAVRVTDVTSACKAAGVLLERGVPTVVVKLGEQGAYYATPGESGHIAAPSVEVVDTVAAGDAFAGALAVAFAEGMSLPEAVRFGVAAGSAAVAKRGAQEAMPSRAEVEELLRSF